MLWKFIEIKASIKYMGQKQGANKNDLVDKKKGPNRNSGNKKFNPWNKKTNWSRYRHEISKPDDRSDI